MFKFGKATNNTVEITVSNRTVVRVLVMVVVTMLGLAALQQATHALVLIFVAFFLALAFNAPVSWLAKRLPGKMRGNRSVATTGAFLVLVLIIGAFLASVTPPIIKQTTTLVESVPQLLRDVQNENTAVGNFVARNNLAPQIDQLSDDLASRLRTASTTAVATVSQVGSSVFATVTVLALTFMMLVEGPHWVGWARRLVPGGRHEDLDVLTARMYRVVKGYVNGQVTLAAIAALVILLVLLLLKIPYPFALMFVVFICGLIPMIGHTIGAFIVTIVALTTSLGAALFVLGFYILYQQIENYAVQPRIQANTTDMSPLLVFVAVVIGVSFSGLLGGLVAIPIMGCIRVAVLFWLEQRDTPRPAVVAKKA